MTTILITGSSGQVGQHLLRFLSPTSERHLRLGVRRPQASTIQGLTQVAFDFTDTSTFPSALQGVDTVFLLRPPHISEIHPFRELVIQMQQAGVREVVFLSVQGAERHAFIPHAKIERLLRESGLAWVFLRPAYFMQNLTSTLWEDVQRGEIALPAAEAPFNWVDVADIGRLAAHVLAHPGTYTGQCLVVSGPENLSFGQVVLRLQAVTGKTLSFRSPSVWRFAYERYKRGDAWPFIAVMIMLHFLPRLEGAPEISQDYTRVTGLSPRSIEDFAKDELLPALQQITTTH